MEGGGGGGHALHEVPPATHFIELALDKKGFHKTADFVKVEGKWLPKDIADGWAEAMAAIERIVLVYLDGEPADALIERS